jgi:hypothetical protein
MLIVVGYSTYLAAQFPERKAKLLKTLWQGTGIFAFAFLVWNIDNQLCHLWRDLRDSLSDKGLGFLSPLTEGECNRRQH